MALKTKPNLLFLIAIRSQPLYKKLAFLLKKIHYQKLIRALTIYRISDNGSQQEWRVNDMLHREDGPAYICTSSDHVSEVWYKHGECHCEDRPALIWWEGKEWWLNGKRHREDGPAVTLLDGSCIWYHHGKQIDPPDEN
jgi:hypothetical protein